MWDDLKWYSVAFSPAAFILLAILFFRISRPLAVLFVLVAALLWHLNLYFIFINFLKFTLVMMSIAVISAIATIFLENERKRIRS